jgi:hypothetical protein
MVIFDRPIVIQPLLLQRVKVKSGKGMLAVKNIIVNQIHKTEPHYIETVGFFKAVFIYRTQIVLQKIHTENTYLDPVTIFQTSNTICLK